MELFVECKCTGKKLEPLTLVVRSDQLIKKESLERVKEQIVDILEKNGEAYVNNHIPGKHGKGEEYHFVFVYSIIDRHTFANEESKWEAPHASIDLFEVRAKTKSPIIQTPNELNIPNKK